MNKLITWYSVTSEGSIQKDTPLGAYTKALTEKPLFSFDYGSINYFVDDSLFTINDEPMTTAQQVEVGEYVDSFEIPFAWYKAKKMAEINNAVTVDTNILSGDTLQHEMASWEKQEKEARAYIADSLAPTPFISGLVVSRNIANETVGVLASKIVVAADTYTAAYSAILGKHQSLVKATELATTVVDFEGIVWL